MRAGPEAAAVLDRKSRTNPMTMAMRFMVTSLDGVINVNEKISYYLLRTEHRKMGCRRSNIINRIHGSDDRSGNGLRRVVCSTVC
jgi:hypothetical protein